MIYISPVICNAFDDEQREYRKVAQIFPQHGVYQNNALYQRGPNNILIPVSENPGVVPTTEYMDTDLGPCHSFLWHNFLFLFPKTIEGREVSSYNTSSFLLLFQSAIQKEGNLYVSIFTYRTSTNTETFNVIPMDEATKTAVILNAYRILVPPNND